ncbi:hypothetical protein GJ654_12430 [Rhodoblastus acidophilus]|uniref:Uncharacterized protein n=1 Tax=Rhodoblastus acidophilus TaxID=1074 RepID=A0A6N8DRI8_RHOAC|nr:hypothetical protein [Rhodoblastus acidophilus]MTV31793.1 hypothetical protein [Rhodoblastus acidophilus]
MAKNWNEMTPSERIDALRGEMDGLAKTIAAAQDDLTGLLNRFIDLQAHQNSTYGLVKKVVTSVERIEANG